jgi:cytochrome P450 family 628
MEVTILFVAAVISGVVAHQCFFKRVEVDTHPLLIAIAFLGAPFAVRHVLRSYFQQYADITIGTSYLLVGCCLLSIWTSMFFYRAFFHPLNKYPGPFLAKLSKLWAFSQTAKTGLKWYQVDEALHKKYGDYVRTGRSLNILIHQVHYAYQGDRSQRTFDHGPESSPNYSWIQF